MFSKWCFYHGIQDLPKPISSDHLCLLAIPKTLCSSKMFCLLITEHLFSSARIYSPLQEWPAPTSFPTLIPKFRFDTTGS